jgi:Amt family ammonium transporter
MFKRQSLLCLSSKEWIIMTRTMRKVGFVAAAAFGLWLATGSTALAQDLTVDDLAVGLNTFFLLIAAALVFFMQAGFAMLTAGLTRAKNTTNILFKNLMDFVMCSIAFWAVGWGLAYGTSQGGFIGFDQFFLTSAGGDGTPAYASWFFQVVFAGTAATIVAGAMAERTKFVAYLIYSFIISLFIYPVVVHWIWSGAGWLNTYSGSTDGNWGFTDFAGSTVVHSVGGWAALIGAMILGPRIGRYGADGKPNAMPGHNVSLAVLGVFILWLGWFGFNPGSQLAIASQSNADAVALVAVTTNLAAAAGALGALLTAWFRYGKPDMGQTLNGVLAGLVAITAGCAYVNPFSAIIIGFLAGPLVVFSAEWLNAAKIDDPVGAVPVHLVCGIWGTLAVGLFASVPLGLFFGGDATLLIAQFVGVIAVGVWTAALAGVMFYALKATVGLRVSREEELAGLDIGEHGSVAYPDILPAPATTVSTPSGSVSSAPAAD